jgi:hypothetical protein
VKRAKFCQRLVALLKTCNAPMKMSWQTRSCTGIHGDYRVRRETRRQWKVHPLGVKHRILLLVPKWQLGISDTVWTELLKLNTEDEFFQVVDTAQRTANTPEEPAVENLRRRSGGIARNQIHELEIEVIRLTEGHSVNPRTLREKIV